MAKYSVDNKHLRDQLIQIGVESVLFLKKLLSEKDKIATGELINSLDYDIIERTNNLLLQILASPHFKYVDQGRRKGAKQPPIKPIESWLKTRHIRFRDNNGRFITTKSAAFIVAKSISKKGIKPLNMKDKLIRHIFANKDKILTEAAGQDIQDLLDRIFYKKT